MFPAAELVAKLPVAGDLNHPIDVDTPEDYERFRPPSASPDRAPAS
jgi:hypothetical protein